MGNFLISVIVPVYQVETYLSHCIESILNQTYQNLEIILVDDGSPDGCPAICDSYALKDTRIKVIHKENGGLSTARNAGLDIAKGDYIGFIDSDDFISPTFYETLLHNALENNAQISECSFIKVSENDMFDFTFPKMEEKKLTVFDRLGALKKLFSHDYYTYVNTVVVWNKLYKRSLFDQIRYPVGKISEDEFTTYRILYECNTFVSTTEILHAYVQRNSSIMGTKFNMRRFDVFLAYEEGIVFFEDRNLPQMVLNFYSRYLETIIEFAEKTYKSKPTNFLEMFQMLDQYYESLCPRILDFLHLHPEFTDSISSFESLFSIYEDWKVRIKKVC